MKRSRSWRGAARLLLLVSIAGLFAGPLDASDVLFRLTDPRGDDRGDGSIRYPLNYYDLKAGDLDLLEFIARRVRGGTEFEATFASPLRSPARRTIDIGGGQMDSVARHGFYGLNLDLYIDTDRVPGSGGQLALPGRKAAIDEAFAWERAVILTPRPHDAKSALKRALMHSLKEQLDKADPGARLSKEEVDRLRSQTPEDVERHVHFSTRIRVLGSRVRFFVPEEFLGGPASANWGYVIFVTGADIDQRFSVAESVGVGSGEASNLFVLPVAPGGAKDRFGGLRPDDDMQPPILDLIVGPGSTQERILGDYDPINDRPVRLPGVVPGKVGKQ